MRRRTLAPALVLLFAACHQADAPEPMAPAVDAQDAFSVNAANVNIGDSIPGEWIVVLRQTADAASSSQRILATHGGQVQHVYQAALKGFAARLPDQAIEAIRRDPSVAYVEPNRWGGIVTTQNNPTWGLDRIDQDDLPLSGTYTYNTDGTGVTAYVLDTGIRLTHNQFGGRAAYIANGQNGDFVGDGRGSASDCHGHGTHVAGTIGGSTYGVAKNVQIRAGRVVNCNGGGTLAMVLAGIDWVTQNGQKPAVVNMSLGYGNVQAIRDAVENSIAAGYNYAVAAGNGDFFGNPQNACFESPAGAPNANTVGATTSGDGEASFSNYGPCVDILAPGVGVLSAWHTSNTATNTISGTSMATPHVAGVIALYLQANPSHTPLQVSNALKSNAIPNTINLHFASQNGGTANRFLNMAWIMGSAPIPPTADQAFSCSGRLCSFDDQSTDADGRVVSWAWNFGDGTSSTEQSPNHTYTNAGTYNVQLTVTDDDGLTGSKSMQVSTNGSSNVAPNANFRTTCSGSTCNFRSISGDEDGSITGYLWEFGDGNTSTSQNPSHNFGSAGTWNVTLRVTDNSGGMNWQSMPVVTNTSNANPFASFTFPASGLTVNFADFSNDSDGSIVARKWEFGDGATSTAANPNHSYPASGTYAVTLIVTDDDGAKHSRTRNVHVSGTPANNPPSAAFSYSCTALSCNFTDGSTDSDGTIVSRAWTFGDGGNSSATNPSHVYAAAGTYTVTLTVTDDDGAMDSASQMVTVVGGGSAPSAGFEYDCAGPSCSFHDTSTDSDGQIVDWNWSFGAGTSSDLPSPNHRFPGAGTYSVQVTVIDDDGMSDTHTMAVTVTSTSANAPPLSNFRYTPNGLTVSFKDISGDSDGSIVSRQWDFGDGSGSSSTNPTHTYASAGTYLVTLEVTDNGGEKNWLSMEVIVAVGNTNAPPFASFTFPASGLTVSFHDFSSDPNGSVVARSWEFGDGKVSTATNPTHTYAQAGRYLVILTVTDNQGRKHSRTRLIVVP